MPRFLLPIIVSLGLLTLVSCGGEKLNDALARNCDVERTPIANFSLCLPAGWIASSQPFGDEGNIVVMISSIESEESVMQIHVKKDPLREPVRSSMAFAEQAAQIARETAPNYSAVRTEAITINAKETLLHVFDANPDPSGDPVRYYQFVTTHGNIAYGFTAVMLPEVNEEVQEALLDMLTNVQFT
jgi:hypothetical protein